MKKIFNNQNGIGIAEIMVLASITAIFLYGAMQFVFKTQEIGLKNIKTIQAESIIESGNETFLQAYRYEEISYYYQLRDAECINGRPFADAILNGHGCGKSDLVIEAFKTPPSIAGDTSLIYSYATKCNIRDTSSDCINKSNPIKVIEIGTSNQEQRISGHSFEYYIYNYTPSTQLLEFIVKLSKYNDNKIIGSPTKSMIGIYSSLRNTINIESTGVVTQVNPEPENRCPGNTWATYFIYDHTSSRCISFGQMGASTGLLFYKKRYFGLRPASGEIIDLLAAATGKPYMVNEDGKTASAEEPVFPSYKKEYLLNFSDLSLVDDQVFGLRGDGESVTLFGLNFETSDESEALIPICKLGKLGWSQNFEGLLALSWNDKILNKVEGETATFYAKTSSGSLLTIFVWVDSSITSDTTPYQCYVFKNQNLQQIEFTRTYGIDRVSDELPYITY